MSSPPSPNTPIRECRSCGSLRSKPLTLEAVHERLDRLLGRAASRVGVGVAGNVFELDVHGVVELEALTDELAGFCLECSPRLRAISRGRGAGG
jgi:hypothetical protein